MLYFNNMQKKKSNDLVAAENKQSQIKCAFLGDIIKLDFCEDTNISKYIIDF